MQPRILTHATDLALLSIVALTASSLLSPPASAQIFERGDASADGKLNIGDAVKALGFLFLGDPAPSCEDAADANDDGRLDISDPVHVLGFLFLGGPPPPEPYPGCGPDRTADALTCAQFSPCPGGPPGCRDGVQGSGSRYRICLPEPGSYNGRLVVWAHGFQDAGTPVGIPEEQMQFGDVYVPDLLTGMGFAFATNSYSKTGLAVRQGVEDILDLVRIFDAEHGTPVKTYVTGASEGGLITALLVEGYPDVFAGGLAACGPVGDFEYQIGYFGNVRALFDYFFPGLIPGPSFEPSPELVATWPQRYEAVVRPAILAPASRHSLEELAATARLQADPADFLATAEVCVQDALRYSIVNLMDAAETLGGFPFENREISYSGSDDDVALNRDVVRAGADPEALQEMRERYATTGTLSRPLVTIHTIYDSQVPYGHEALYAEKCVRSGAEGALHFNFAAERFGHCNFTVEEVLLSFGVLLLKAGDGDLVKEIQLGEGAGAEIRDAAIRG